ncbi:MAG TPA: UDP-N-acetylmuramoyl-L-alanyl-D-glutamate--2,6-diaminopimelate ligase [Gammaproteobacteria bacterium]|nr:UDP-N-acetylmuramoyl-L-alanyl-D-glutamate--2,6-diaminopimelate ligase [Gammaproteobacteria bacterium]
MRLSELKIEGQQPWIDCHSEVTGITSDSRKVTPGTIFAAWKGEHTDGHRFIDDALANGASAVLYEYDTTVKSSVPSYKSANVRRDYSSLAYQIAGIPGTSIDLIGITGTNGKTTTTQMVANLLRGLGKRVGTIGTLGAEVDGEVFRQGMTTPPAEIVASDLLQMHDAGVEYCVMEVSSHALSQERLYGLQFQSAVWTNLTPEHLDFHGSMEAYADAKAQLFRDYCPDSSHWVMNADDDVVSAYALPDTFTFGIHGESLSDRNIEIVSNRFETNKTQSTLRINGVEHRINSPFIGLFNVYNLAAAIGVVSRLGFSLESVLKVVETLDGIPGRMEIVSDSNEPLVLVDYAHTPDALKKALSTLDDLPHNRIICVFGCGGDRDQEKRPVMGQIVSESADICYLTNDNPRHESPDAIAEMILEGINDVNREKVHVILNREGAIRAALQSSQIDDIVLIAGKGHENYQINGNEVVDFDDRKIARKYLSETFA